MHDLMDLVREFHVKNGQAIGDARKPDLTVEGELRMDLISEEYGELLCAIGGFKIIPNPDYVSEEATPEAPTKELVQFETPEEQRLAVADALGDLSYVIAGAALAWGIPLGECVEEIHRSNMTKGEIKRADGKVLKGPSYDPPDLAKAWERAADFETWMEQDDTCAIPEPINSDETEEHEGHTHTIIQKDGAFFVECTETEAA